VCITNVIQRLLHVKLDIYKRNINQMTNFQSLGLHEVLIQSLLDMEFHTPTEIQAQTIPHALAGKDVLGSAQTGTGKTLAYGIPLVSYLLNKTHGSAIVLVPTRELATQILSQLHMLLGKRSHIRTALLIGGDSMFRQLAQLRHSPRLIVGTPGRVNDHLERQSLDLSDTGFLVFDETDRMLNMGFSIQIQHITKRMPAKRQTLMFSATMSPTVIKSSQSYLNEPERISVGSTTAPIEKIKQETIKTTDSDKYGVLVDLIDKTEGSFVVFMKTKHSTDRLAQRLNEHYAGDSVRGSRIADAIHGDLQQRQRERVIDSFRKGKYRVLVATDVAARGLDIPHIEYVVNYDLPINPEDYIHRIGRTGRAGKEGIAISLITPADHGKWRMIQRLINDGEHTSPEDQRRSQRSGGGGFGGGGRSSFGGDRRGSSGGGRDASPFDGYAKKRDADSGNRFGNDRYNDAYSGNSGAGHGGGYSGGGGHSGGGQRQGGFGGGASSAPRENRRFDAGRNDHGRTYPSRNDRPKY
jgi:ATP-dependent RNA helicase DeaD